MITSYRGGVLFPLGSGEHGHMDFTQDEAALVRSAIGQLISTRPGERVSRPGFGLDLRGLLFDPSDDVTGALAGARVREALQRWEPRIVVVGVTCAAPADGELSVVVEYRHRSTGRTGRFEGTVRR